MACRIKDLEAKEGPIVPSTVPPEWEAKEFSHILYTNPETSTASQLPWVSQPAPDGQPITVEKPVPLSEKPVLKPGPKESHDTLPMDNI